MSGRLIFPTTQARGCLPGPVTTDARRDVEA